MSKKTYVPNPKLDLVLERVVDLPVEKIWAAWTQPENIKKWFAPKPWSVADCEVDLRPGGKFYTVMKSPEGQEYPASGCFLEIIENEKLVWTDALTPDYRPSENPFFTGMLILEKVGSGTKYTAIGMHKDEESRKKHQEMGFEAGWSQCLDQLVAHMKKL